MDQFSLNEIASQKQPEQRAPAHRGWARPAFAWGLPAMLSLARRVGKADGGRGTSWQVNPLFPMEQDQTHLCERDGTARSF